MIQMHKLYSWRALAVLCVSNGEAKTPNEFGVKLGFATMPRRNLIN